MTLGLMSGTLPDGTHWELHLTASSTRDVQVTDEGVFFITWGGALGRLDPKTQTLAALDLGSAPLRGFVEDSTPLMAFDDQGRMGALKGAELVPMPLRRVTNPIEQAWSTPEGIAAVERLPSGQVLWNPPVGPDHVLPESDIWALVDDTLWWGLNKGEWGGAFGTLERQVAAFAVHGFGEFDGRPVVAGGSSHLGVLDAEIVGLDGSVLYNSPTWFSLSRDPPESELNGPVVWVGELAQHAMAVDHNGDVVRRDADAWTAMGSLDPPHQTGRATTGPTVRRHTRDASGDVWLVGPGRPLIRLGAKGPVAIHRATVPAARDLRWRDGRLWVLDGSDVYERDGTGWRRHGLPYLVPKRNRYLSAIFVDAEGPTWLWADYDADRWHTIGPAKFLHPIQVHPLEQDGTLIGASSSCEKIRLPCRELPRTGGGRPDRSDGRGHLQLGGRWWNDQGKRMRVPGTLAYQAFPTKAGGWLVQRADLTVELLDAKDVSRSLGAVPRIRDMAETPGTLWVAGDGLWTVERGRMEPVTGLPPIGTAWLLEPMDGGQVAVVVDAGILILTPPA